MVATFLLLFAWIAGWETMCLICEGAKLQPFASKVKVTGFGMTSLFDLNESVTAELCYVMMAAELLFLFLRKCLGLLPFWGYCFTMPRSLLERSGAMLTFPIPDLTSLLSTERLSFFDSCARPFALLPSRRICGKLCFWFSCPGVTPGLFCRFTLECLLSSVIAARRFLSLFCLLATPTLCWTILFFPLFWTPSSSLRLVSTWLLF